MKKFKKDNQIVTVTDPNHYSIFIREGYKEVKTKEQKSK